MECAKASEKLNKHQARTEATLRSVLDAAEEIFVRDGYERAQIETIASQAGRTKGAVYAHFRSKEDIFFALLERKSEERREAFRRHTQGASGPLQVKAIKELFLDALEDDHWPILMLEFKLFALRNKGSLERVRELYRLLYEDVSRRLIPKIGIAGKKKRDRMAFGIAVLRGIPSTIVLERQFNPVLEQPEIAEQVFGGLFDSLLGVEERAGVTPSRKRSRRSKLPAGAKSPAKARTRAAKAD